MFIENYPYKECIFTITKEGKQYWARFEEIITYSDDLDDLKRDKIPQKYHSCRIFKL